VTRESSIKKGVLVQRDKVKAQSETKRATTSATSEDVSSTSELKQSTGERIEVYSRVSQGVLENTKVEQPVSSSTAIVVKLRKRKIRESEEAQGSE
jgi:hypothetical protein